MITAYDLLMTAPESQVIRARIAYQAVANGCWQDAASVLESAIAEEGDSIWADDVKRFVSICRAQSIPHVSPEVLSQLAKFVAEHHHAVLIQDGELFICSDFGGIDRPAGMVIAGQWDRVAPTVRDVKAALGY